MCVPVAVIAGASLAMSAAGTAMTAYGSYQGGKAAKAQAYYQAQMARQNAEAQAQMAEYEAQMAGYQAKDATARGIQAEKRHWTDVGQFLGEQRATLAANDVVVDDGSALDIQRDTQAMGAMDAMTIRSNAAREAWGHTADRNLAQYQASVSRAGGDAAYQMGRFQGRQAAWAGTFGAGTALTSGLGNLAFKWYKYGGKNLELSDLSGTKPTVGPPIDLTSGLRHNMRR
ncbi:MAG: phage protein [Rhodospirillaceae bacterium]|nr:MAG: phage protein [Rhodospirillaceae bacterium]